MAIITGLGAITSGGFAISACPTSPRGKKPVVLLGSSVVTGFGAAVADLSSEIAGVRLCIGGVGVSVPQISLAVFFVALTGFLVSSSE